MLGSWYEKSAELIKAHKKHITPVWEAKNLASLEILLRLVWLIHFFLAKVFHLTSVKKVHEISKIRKFFM